MIMRDQTEIFAMIVVSEHGEDVSVPCIMSQQSLAFSTVKQ